MAIHEDYRHIKDAAITNPSSQFNEWSIKLKNGATLTGIAHIPQIDNPKAFAGLPLLVAIHGGTCSAYNWDISPKYSASQYSALFKIPFIAINRPNYLGSSGWLVDRSRSPSTPSPYKATDDSGYFEEEARWYHELIFPALWKEFALPNGCASMVTTSHSMGVASSVIAAGLYARVQDSAQVEYVWAGMVVSGSADERTEENAEMVSNRGEAGPTTFPPGYDPNVHLTPLSDAQKLELMLGPPGLCDPELPPLITKQTTPYFIGEVKGVATTWRTSKRDFQAAVKIPVLCGLGEYDWLYKGNRSNIESFCSGFVSSPRVEGAVIEAAPHSIEMSPAARGWWFRVFGFAVEVNAGRETRPTKPKAYRGVTTFSML